MKDTASSYSISLIDARHLGKAAFVRDLAGQFLRGRQAEYGGFQSVDFELPDGIYETQQAEYGHRKIRNSAIVIEGGVLVAEAETLADLLLQLSGIEVVLPSGTARQKEFLESLLNQLLGKLLKEVWDTPKVAVLLEGYQKAKLDSRPISEAIDLTKGGKLESFLRKKLAK